MVYGRPLSGSAAPETVAGPKPFHTGVAGLKECVRSTNCFDEMILYASASDPFWAGAALAMREPNIVAIRYMRGKGGFGFMTSLF
jgi:hypothetical protein